ncbi:TRAP transporter small permease [Stappia sp. ES.058]|uniref:TRAP transporter small permease n=1 Tax=Stappia sp. ES.058 TaxID=1881061 RepID=UPI00087C8337|nr:TRAP transporter small permease subunit [Stappia sp. ES.058]SDU42968.1 TRAP-type C4-dicarboxylate transport system, small permease component [Stappia sp. ES.058]
MRGGVLYKIRSIFAGMAGALLLVIIAANAVNIFYRFAFGKAFNAVYPWTIVIFTWVVFLGFYVYVYDKKDVAVDGIIKRLPVPLQKAVAIFVTALMLFILGLILWTAPELISIQFNPMDMVGLPYYTLALPLFASAILISITVTLRLWQVLTDEKPPYAREPLHETETGLD